MPKFKTRVTLRVTIIWVYKFFPSGKEPFELTGTSWKGFDGDVTMLQTMWVDSIILKKSNSLVSLKKRPGEINYRIIHEEKSV